jgi:N-acetylmuramoyl-L-alanine amidase
MQAFDMIKIERSHKKSGVLTILLLLILILLTGLIKISHAEEKDSKSVGIRTIVIDPGHGGYDKGVQGPGGSLEKELTLNFAQILAKELKVDYEVVLTRNGDYQVALTRRASVANNHGADMFISIHTGSGSRSQMDTWSIFYFKKADQKEGGIKVETAVPENVEDTRIQWDQVQLRHQKQSLALAGCMKAQLAGAPGIDEVNIAGAALRVLEGLEMPAIIIETGYLTNLTTEKRLNNIYFLTDAAKNIKKGIDVYLSR